MALKNSLLNFYRGKSVLVTGHTGFKGAWLATWLNMMGSKVAGIALPPENGKLNLFSSTNLARSINSYFADIREFGSILRLFKKCQPEIVIHNAAQALVLRSYREPIETFATNVIGTVHVLEAARRTPSVRAVVVITSDKCYENREWVWGYRENEPLGGHDPYSSSKACAELVTTAYRRSFFSGSSKLALGSARAGNVIGGGDWAENRLIPDLVRGILQCSRVQIRNPLASRPWQHVLEPLCGYLMLAKRLYEGQTEFACAWNFGPAENSVPVEVVAARIVQLWGDTRIKIDKAKPKRHEAQNLVLDSTKARAVLGWNPLLSLDEALHWTVDWYRSFSVEPKRAGALTRGQIQEYVDRQC